jgi:5-methylcytosine-specific restriction endonuclease McrA
LHYSQSTINSGVARDSHGRIKRSESAKEEFLREHGLSKVPNGYEVDHITPLYAGGSDTPGNMQLLSKAQHHAKTKSDYQRYGR